VFLTTNFLVLNTNTIISVKIIFFKVQDQLVQE